MNHTPFLLNIAERSFYAVLYGCCTISSNFACEITH